MMMTRRSKEIATNTNGGGEKIGGANEHGNYVFDIDLRFFQAITCVHWFFWMAYQEHYVRARKENNHFNLHHL